MGRSRRNKRKTRLSAYLRTPDPVSFTPISCVSPGARADELEEQISSKEEEIPELRVDVATGDASESDLEAAKEEKANLEAELLEIRETELPAQLETVELLEDRRGDVRSEEGDKLAAEYAEAQRTLQNQKRELLEKLAAVCDELGELDTLKEQNDVGSYNPDVPNVPPVHGVVKGGRSSEDMDPAQIRRRVEELTDTLETLGS